MATTTTYSFTKPTVGGDEDTWGTSLNGNWDDLDDLLDGTTVVTGIKIDDTASVVDNADNTKVAQFQASGITTATTRTFTFPDASGTFMLTSAIGSTVQAYDAGLASIAGLTTAADRMIYTTASDTYAVATLTAAGRALLDDADAAAQRTTLGLGNIATTDLIDEDDMVSDTAAQAPTQQSVKAYVDASVSTQAVIAAGSFDGTGTPAWNYRNGFGATVTDNGTGDYTVAFDAAEADANYVVQVSPESPGAGVSNRQFAFAHTLTTSGFSVRVTDINGSAVDRDGIHVTVTRLTWS